MNVWLRFCGITCRPQRGTYTAETFLFCTCCSIVNLSKGECVLLLKQNHVFHRKKWSFCSIIISRQIIKQQEKYLINYNLLALKFRYLGNN